MIYNHPVGGIGNMFFQIASIWTLAKDNDDELCLLNIEKLIENLINHPNNPIYHADKFRYVFNRFPNHTGVINNVIQTQFTYTPLNYVNETEYVGYFQCEKYFKHRRNEILELLKPSDEFNDDINKYKELFGNISLHVRRGNYVNWSAFDIIKMDYYQNAISLLPEDMKILIFSNDLNWCRQNFIGERFEFINEIDYISLYLMGKMKHHIIVNSSFSWWGAWLSDDGIVIAPKLWFGDNFEDGTDIVPTNWIKL